ncbi:MAG TPA: DUF2934 domain-containing protein [Verrucomicrobiae bacterium]|jgi:hypothetical protein|nr:DUF2934 domain-containing protein [Verrucomicrobiae bacterium]
MNTTTETKVNADESTVSLVAYQLWEQAGRPTGRDLEFWLAAETKLREQAQPEAAPKSSAVRPARAGARKSWPKPYPSLPKF